MVSRRVAEPRLAALALSLPAGNLPISMARRGERTPFSRRARVRAAGYRGFRRRPVWVVEVAYAKASPTELLAKIEVENKGLTKPSCPCAHAVVSQLLAVLLGEAPQLAAEGDGIVVDHPRLSGYRLDAAPTADGNRPQPLFCDNETNTARLFGSAPITAYPKDGINDHLIAGASTVNPEQRGTQERAGGTS